MQRSAMIWIHRKNRHMASLMTIEEVAAYLRLSKDTVYRMAQAGKIPASKVGTQWRFRQNDVDAWLEENKNVSKDKGMRSGEKR